MARIPLEDNFTDVIGKAQRGLHISDEELATRAEVKHADLLALKAGRPLTPVLRRVARHLRLGPDALETLAARKWYPAQPAFPTGFAAFNTPFGPDLSVNSYLIWDPRARLAAAFDTGTDCGALLDTVHAEKLELRYLFLTHTHEDHVADLAKLAATGAEVWLSEREPAPPGDTPLHTFDKNVYFHLGSLAIKPLATPGHSPGQTTYFVTGLSWPLAIVGDSLFASSMGGSEEHYKDQLENNRTQLFTLPRDTVLACGHGPLTTLAQEKQHNPFFAR